jgi:hypothetical protein
MELFMELSDPRDRSERLAFEREAGVSTRLHFEHHADEALA